MRWEAQYQSIFKFPVCPPESFISPKENRISDPLLELLMSSDAITLPIYNSNQRGNPFMRYSAEEFFRKLIFLFPTFFRTATAEKMLCDFVRNYLRGYAQMI